MTVEVPTAAAKKIERPVPIDALLKLAQEDIPREQARLRSLANTGIDADRLLTEMHGTLLDVTKDLARGLVEVRDWAYEYMNGIGDHLEAVDTRLDVIEEFGGESTLLPDDAEVLSNVCAGAHYLASQLLQGPFPIGERDDEGKQKLAELIAFAEQGERIVKESLLVMDDDDDLDDGDEGDDDSESEGDDDSDDQGQAN
jgi:hypothetical protein